MTHVLTPTAREEKVAGAGGLNIFVRSWRPQGAARSVVVICHGFNAHSGQSAAVIAMSAALRQLLADVFALYVKTKSVHWHIGGRHFREYHELLDEQAAQIFAMTDAVAQNVRESLAAPR